VTNAPVEDLLCVNTKLSMDTALPAVLSAKPMPLSPPTLRPLKLALRELAMIRPLVEPPS
jgi:hypothetical protein